MKRRNYIGCKFYRYDENEKPEVIRILRRRTDEDFICLDKNGNKIKRNINRLLEQYTLLKPHAIISFNAVQIKNGKYTVDDILVLAGKNGEKDTVACRQCITNPYGQMAGVNLYGFSVSKENCMGFNYDAVKECNKVLKTVNVNTYLDDSPNDIINLLGASEKEFNKILSKTKQSFKNCDVVGVVDNIKDLLSATCFWKDYNALFKILDFPEEIKEDTLTTIQLTYLEKKISYIMDNVTIVPYWYDINLDGITDSQYMLIKDTTNRIYLINYLRGSFIQQEHMSDEEVEKFRSVKV